MMIFDRLLNRCYWKCDVAHEWQTYLHDPASISMEGILMFNKHLLFLVIVIVMFVGWLLAFTVYYFVEYHNKYSSKFVHSKELEIVWTSIPALILLLLATPSLKASRYSQTASVYSVSDLALLILRAYPKTRL